ncbi:MAG: AEC family transporter [Propionibacteriales bacterium]|nr:AEC family transporter [Propionibacteriales bacterium]
MSGIFEGFAVIGTIVAVGYVVGRACVLGADAQTVLSRVAFFVATPCLLTTTLAETDLPTVFSASLVVTAASSLAVAGAYVTIAVVRRRPVGETAIGAMSSGYVNAGNLGIPIAIYVLGDASFVAPTLLFQLALFAPVVTTVLDTVSTDRAVGQRLSWVRIASQPLRNPITIGSGVGLILAATGWRLPQAVASPVALMGALAIPAILIAFGISLHGARRPGQGDTGVALWTVVALKNITQPLLAYSLGAFALGLNGLTLLAVVITAALPTAQNVFTYAVRYEQAVVLARDSALVTTIISVPVLFAVTLLLS